jgi:hypothetical protein
MRKTRVALIAAALALLALPSAASAVDPTQPAYGGPLTGAQEVPAVATSATGQGTAVISADGSTITYLVTYSGLSGTLNAAHFHTGAAGVAGGVILPLVAGPSPMSGTLTAADFKASGSVTTRPGGRRDPCRDDLFQPPTSPIRGESRRGRVTVAAPTPTTAPTEEPAAPTVPPTSSLTPVHPADRDDPSGVLALVGLLAMTGTFLWIGRRRAADDR